MSFPTLYTQCTQQALFFPTPIPCSKVTSSSEQAPPSANLRKVISPYIARESDQLTLSQGRILL